MRRLTFPLFALLFAAYLFAAISIALHLDGSVSIGAPAHLVSALALLIWLLLVLLQGKMTNLPAIVTTAISACNLCATLPLMITVLSSSWSIWMAMHLGFSIALSPYAACLVCWPPEFLTDGLRFLTVGMKFYSPWGLCGAYWCSGSESREINVRKHRNTEKEPCRLSQQAIGTVL